MIAGRAGELHEPRVEIQHVRHAHLSAGPRVNQGGLPDVVVRQDHGGIFDGCPLQVVDREGRQHVVTGPAHPTDLKQT